MKKSKKEVKKNDESIGSLWINKSKKTTFMSGVIEDSEGNQTRIVVFKNSYKEKENQPDYRILKARENEEKEESEETADDLPF